ncbi:iron-containing alcohol dehydrogenase [Acinetobacter indicus]|nr:iron-containing alcohol dehydrogenase [Acinetobacter indicus]
MALEAIRCLATALPELVQHPNDIQLREQVSYGAWLAGICLGSVGMAIHHKICHSLGALLSHSLL